MERAQREVGMLRMGFGQVDTTPAVGLRILPLASTPPWPRAAGVNGPSVTRSPRIDRRGARLEGVGSNQRAAQLLDLGRVAHVCLPLPGGSSIGSAGAGE